MARSGRRHRWRPAFVGICTALALSAAMPEVGAKPSPPHSEDDAAYIEEVNNEIVAMQGRGSSQGAIDRMLWRRYGWKLVASGDREPTVMPRSENSGVSLSTPSVYFNTSTGRYQASASFAWKDCTDPWNGQVEPCYATDWSGTNVGGYDGFGIRVSKEVSRRSQSFVVASSTNCRTTYTNPSDADGWGVVYRNQDKFQNPCGTSHYNWHRGSVVYSFLMLPGCPRGQYQFSSKMAHTWSSTGVSGISVGPRGISVSFSSTENSWTAVSNPKNFYPCGT